MRMTRLLTLLMVCFTALTISAQAQKTTAKKTSSRSTTSKSTATVPSLDVRAARVKVSNQLYNLNVFLSRLGPIAQNIEAIDNDAKTKKLKKESIDQNEAAKQKVVSAIRNIKDGLMNLETEFKTKPALKKYLPTIQGITDLAAQAETSAVAGQFVASNAPLKTAQQKLNSTLSMMPDAEL
jgi:hypothetical protein